MLTAKISIINIQGTPDPAQNPRSPEENVDTDHPPGPPGEGGGGVKNIKLKIALSTDMIRVARGLKFTIYVFSFCCRSLKHKVPTKLGLESLES